MSGTKIVSFDDEPLILVDNQDNIIGFDSKAQVHRGAGVLHRAFSIFIVSAGGKVLLQQRSPAKPLWPLFWSNSCCSHPRQGEETLAAAHRRLREELGLDTELAFAYRFQYQAQFNASGSENELCHVFVGRLEDEPVIDVNPTEVAAWRWLASAEVDRLVATASEPITPWLVMEWPRLRQDFPHLIGARWSD